MPLIGGPSGQTTGLPVPGVGTPPQTLPEGIEGVPIIVNGQIIGWNIGGEFFTQEEVDALIATGRFPEEPSGAGAAYHPPAWRPGELELEQQQLQADIAATEQRLEEIRMQEEAADARQLRALEAEREMLEMRLDNSRRELLYGEIGATKRTLIQEKGQARQLAAQLQGKDPFRQAAVLSGGVMRGTSPAQAFGTELQSFINQPLPQASMDMTTQEMEGILTAMQGIQAPAAPGFGMAKGGIIEMERGGDGAFSMRPTHRESYLVGDAAGIIPGVTETLTVEKGPFGIKSVEVTPLVGAGADGFRLNPPSQPEFLSMQQALAPLYADMELPFVPRAMGRHKSINFPFLWGKSGDYGPFSNRAEFLSGMGVDPQLVMAAQPFGRFAKGTIFYREGGELRPIPSMEHFKGMGFDLGDVVQLGGLALSKMGTPGRALTQFPVVPPGSLSGFGAVGTPIIEPTTGIILPAPHKIAGIWNQLTDAQKTNILSAYAMAGIQPDILEGIVGRATPQAGAFGGRRIGFTGGVL